MDVYNNCPIDGRHLTDYRSAGDVNNELKHKFNIQNSFEYNHFLTKNGLNEMNKQTDKVHNLYKCSPQKVEPTNVTPADFSSNKYHTF